MKRGEGQVNEEEGKVVDKEEERKGRWMNGRRGGEGRGGGGRRHVEQQQLKSETNQK